MFGELPRVGIPAFISPKPPKPPKPGKIVGWPLWLLLYSRCGFSMSIGLKHTEQQGTGLLQVHSLIRGF